MRTVLAVLALVFMAGCASTETTEPNVDVSTSVPIDIKVDSFAYMKTLGTDKGGGRSYAYGSRSQFSNRLITSMNRELSRRGLRQSTDPDVMIDFTMYADGEIDLTTGEDGGILVRHSNWNRSYAIWPEYEETLASYNMGTLVITFIDRNGGRVVGEGSARGRSGSTIETNYMPQKDIDFIVKRVISSLIKEHQE